MEERNHHDRQLRVGGLQLRHQIESRVLGVRAGLRVLVHPEIGDHDIWRVLVDQPQRIVRVLGLGDEDEPRVVRHE